MFSTIKLYIAGKCKCLFGTPNNEDIYIVTHESKGSGKSQLGDPIPSLGLPKSDSEDPIDTSTFSY